MPHRLAAHLPLFLRNSSLYHGPAYRLPASGPDGLISHFQRWPLITKHDIRRNFPNNFLPAGVELEDLLDQNALEVEHTSGTSEERTALLLPRGWWAEQEDRALRLNPEVAVILDRHPGARRVTIGSPNCNNDVCYSGVPSVRDRIVGESLFVSLSRFPFLWSERDLERMAEETLEWQPVFLDVDPVYGVAFARYCERERIVLPSLRFVLASYEFVSVNHRRILERAFGVPLYNLYGSTETGHLLMETRDGDMAPSLETACLEVVKEQEGIGELLVTTLTNQYMPLIRYWIGDLVQSREVPYGTRYFVHGRAADAVRKPDGTRATVAQIDQCFAGLEGVAHYQLVQVGAGEFLLRFIEEAPGLDDEALGTVKERLLLLLGQDVTLNTERTDLLLPEKSGKFRLSYPLNG